MEAFFNELSVRMATDDEEAKRWLTELAKVGQLLKKIVESMQEHTFTFRRREDFGEMAITATAKIREYLFENFDQNDTEFIFLFGVFDSPYITTEDPQLKDYEYLHLRHGGTEHSGTGLVAAFIKKGMAISLNCDSCWDVCDYVIEIESLNQSGTDTEVSKRQVKHASKQDHIVQCHLLFLSNLFNWTSHRPRFDVSTETQTLFPMLELYTLLLGEGGWDEFYHDISHIAETERIGRINAIAERIAQLQRWEEATGNLASQNRNRKVFTIPNSNLLASLDTQHGEFEIHRRQRGNNHLGAISFDGKRFKQAEPDRSLEI